MKDFNEGLLEEEGWQPYLSAYTRPGYVKTDVTCNTGLITPREGAQSAVRLALLPQGGPSDLFSENDISCF
ncbi:hypothetical protein ACOSQ2_001058 [Xanthoceras sorbifolium]